MVDLFHPGEWPFGTLGQYRYRVILADPPWFFENYSAKGQHKSPHRHYDCLTSDQIEALPVRELAADDCVLALWATAPTLPIAMMTLTLWGFTYKTCGAWAKRSKGGEKWTFGTGYIYRSAAEIWLIGTRGNPRARVRNVRNLIDAPVREHSRKPDQLRADLTRQFAGPRCELFAREQTFGWDCWGDQLKTFEPAA
jgi:N6-adenosine-specific RNA methylase IME4